MKVLKLIPWQAWFVAALAVACIAYLASPLADPPVETTVPQPAPIARVYVIERAAEREENERIADAIEGQVIRAWDAAEEPAVVYECLARIRTEAAKLRSMEFEVVER